MRCKCGGPDRLCFIARHAPPAQIPEAPLTSSRRGLRLRYVDGGKRSYVEVEHPGELERIKPSLTQSEYDAGIELRRLWVAGTMNPESQSSAMSRLGMPRASFTDDHDDEHRCEMQDELRGALRSMGMLGMGGRFALEVVVYERRVKIQDALLHLRQALSRLAEHLRQGRRQAA